MSLFFSFYFFLYAVGLLQPWIGSVLMHHDFATRFLSDTETAEFKSKHHIIEFKFESCSSLVNCFNYDSRFINLNPAYLPKTLQIFFIILNLNTLSFLWNISLEYRAWSLSACVVLYIVFAFSFAVTLFTHEHICGVAFSLAKHIFKKKTSRCEKKTKNSKEFLCLE